MRIQLPTTNPALRDPTSKVDAGVPDDIFLLVPLGTAAPTNIQGVRDRITITGDPAAAGDNELRGVSVVHRYRRPLSSTGFGVLSD